MLFELVYEKTNINFFPSLAIAFDLKDWIWSILMCSAQTTLKRFCKHTFVRAYLMLYFACQSFLRERDPQIPSLSFRNTHRNSLCHSGRRSNDTSQSRGLEGNQPTKVEDRNLKKRSLVKDWQWPVYDLIEKPFSGSELVKREKENDKGAEPFRVIYRRLESLPWASKVQVDIFSPSLIEFIDLIPGKVGRRVQNQLSLQGTELFFIYDDLKKQLSDAIQKLSESFSAGDSTTCKTIGVVHLGHFLRYLHEELDSIDEIYRSMKSERKISFDMLWALFPPGEIVSYPCNISDENLCGIVKSTEYRKDRRGIVQFKIKISKWDYNCKSWTEYSENRSVEEFKGDTSFDSMKFYPLYFKDDPDATKVNFLNIGTKFCEMSMLEPNSFKNYKGSLYRAKVVDRCVVILKDNADGRVMLDLGSFSKMNPGYLLGSAQPPCDVIRDNEVTAIDITSAPERMYSPATVYGFSFRLKQWGCFSVCGLSEIEFNESAFEKLVMDEETKDLTDRMVCENVKQRRHHQPRMDDSEFTNESSSGRLDLMDAKGEGCIILCYGPPGTGKTLTAESLAEKYNLPLWSLSVSELGTTPADLESMLLKIMDVAVRWSALLLLDEADIYLERRASSDLTRNAMTGVFLRQLEYFRGVLFLTTNRDKAFDDAFCSRITLFLRYENFTKEQRSQIWTNLLKRVGLKDLDPDVLDEFIQYEFNGREIRNVMQSAQTVARSKKKPLAVEHIKQALRVLDSAIKLQGRGNA